MQDAVTTLRKLASEEPSLHDYVARHPELALVPGGALVGGALRNPKDEGERTRGVMHGALTGAGMAGGGVLGRAMSPQDPGAGLLLGMGGGGLASYLAAQGVLDKLFPNRAARMRKRAGIVTDLKGAKFESDRGNYPAKHGRMRELIRKYPDDFAIDSRQGDIVGVTHVPTGFRMHLPSRVLPLQLQELQMDKETGTATRVPPQRRITVPAVTQQA